MFQSHLASLIFFFRVFKIVLCWCLFLTIPLRMVRCWESILNIKPFKKFINVLIFEISTIVSYNGLWNAISIHDVVQNEGCNFISSDGGQRNDLNPLCVLSSHDNEFVSIRWRWLYSSHKIKSPLIKGQIWCKWLKFLQRCMDEVTMHFSLLRFLDKL